MTARPFRLEAPELPFAKAGSAGRLAACRACGKGRHEPGPIFAGGRIMVGICCEDCPHMAELNPERAR